MAKTNIDKFAIVALFAICTYFTFEYHSVLGAFGAIIAFLNI